VDCWVTAGRSGLHVGREGAETLERLGFSAIGYELCCGLLGNF
jgi:hypothetical protein